MNLSILLPREYKNGEIWISGSHISDFGGGSGGSTGASGGGGRFGDRDNIVLEIMDVMWWW